MIGYDVLKEMFGANIPADAVELAMNPPEGSSDEQVLDTLRFIAGVNSDPRVSILINAIVGSFNKASGRKFIDEMDGNGRSAYIYIMGQGILAGLNAIDGAKEQGK